MCRRESKPKPTMESGFATTFTPARASPDRPGLLRFVAAYLLDDAVYGAGVWAGAFAERTVVPLTPVSAARARAVYREPAYPDPQSHTPDQH